MSCTSDGVHGLPISTPFPALTRWRKTGFLSPQLRILGQMLGLVEGVVGSLAETWEEAGNGQVELTSPAESWALGGVSQRAQAAGTFGGFNPRYEVPPLTSIVTNPREAKRAGIAEALRQEGLGIDEVEAQ
jgi:hypothetical protein